MWVTRLIAATGYHADVQGPIAPYAPGDKRENRAHPHDVTTHPGLTRSTQGFGGDFSSDFTHSSADNDDAQHGSPRLTVGPQKSTCGYQGNCAPSASHQTSGEFYNSGQKSTYGSDTVKTQVGNASHGECFKPDAIVDMAPIKAPKVATVTPALLNSTLHNLVRDTAYGDCLAPGNMSVHIQSEVTPLNNMKAAPSEYGYSGSNSGQKSTNLSKCGSQCKCAHSESPCGSPDTSEYGSTGSNSGQKSTYGSQSKCAQSESHQTSGDTNTYGSPDIYAPTFHGGLHGSGTGDINGDENKYGNSLNQRLSVVETALRLQDATGTSHLQQLELNPPAYGVASSARPAIRRLRRQRNRALHGNRVSTRVAEIETRIDKIDTNHHGIDEDSQEELAAF